MHHCPECETLHNITEGSRKLMVQNFDNGVKLEVDKGTGDVVAYNRKGDRIGNWENVRVTKLTEIQLMAESL